MQKLFDIHQTLEIQNMKTTKYKYAVKKQTKAAAFQYLIGKWKIGKLIIHRQIHSADYLLPDFQCLTKYNWMTFCVK